MQFDEQIKRIKEKLCLAEKADTDLKAFSAEAHKYKINPPLPLEKITAFENEYGVKLPADYAAFLTLFGNGGAGPYYGIYPLGEHLNEFVDDFKAAMKLPCLLYPRMSDEYWNGIIACFDDDDMSDEEYDEKINSLYGGLLPLGTQGCSYCHALVLRGEHAGKVVNIDVDMQKPTFTFEDNFLDWYERWLDEIISGDLLQGGPSRFGFNRGGDAEKLIEVFLNADDDQTKYECLTGVLKKKNVSEAVINAVHEAYAESKGEIKAMLLKIMIKFDYVRARAYLLSEVDTNLLDVCRSVLWYAKERCGEWFDVICEKLPYVNDIETFSFCTHVLDNSDRDYTKFVIPFAKHKDRRMRDYVFYLLGKCKYKEQCVDSFIDGLHDAESSVILATLQAVSGLKDERLLPHYDALAKRLTDENHTFDEPYHGYLVSNLNRRLKECGLPCI